MNWVFPGWKERRSLYTKKQPSLRGCSAHVLNFLPFVFCNHPLSSLRGSRIAHSHNWFYIGGYTSPHQLLAFGLPAGKAVPSVPTDATQKLSVTPRALSFLSDLLSLPQSNIFSPFLRCCAKHSLFSLRLPFCPAVFSVLLGKHLAMEPISELLCS